MLAVVKSAPVDGPEGTSVRDCAVPKAGPDEVLIRVAAAAVCGTDKHIYHWDPSIRDKATPARIYGHEFWGFGEELGSRAQRRYEGHLGIYDSGSAQVRCVRDKSFRLQTNKEHNGNP